MLPIYFDMDNTLTRTSDYQIQEVEKQLLEQNDSEGLEEFRFHCMSGNPRHLFPERFSKMLSDVLKDKNYILKVLPTPLFNYFFLIPGNQPRLTQFHILTHRGEDIISKNLTLQWLQSQKPYVAVGNVHSISYEKYPSKMEYLLKIHPDGEFILVDDNPLFYVDVEHPYHKQLRIFDMYDKYDVAYKHQKHVTYYDGIFNLNL